MMNEPKSGPPANFAFASAPAREPSKSPPAQPPRPQSRLAKVQGGRKREPARVMIVGPEGVGKTSTLASAPAPIVIDADGGSGLVAIARYPFRDGPGGDVPESLEEIHAAVADLTENEHVGAPPSSAASRTSAGARGATSCSTSGETCAARSKSCASCAT